MEGPFCSCTYFYMFSHLFLNSDCCALVKLDWQSPDANTVRTFLLLQNKKQFCHYGKKLLLLLLTDNKSSQKSLLPFYPSTRRCIVCGCANFFSSVCLIPHNRWGGKIWENLCPSYLFPKWPRTDFLQRASTWQCFCFKFRKFSQVERQPLFSWLQCA